MLDMRMLLVQESLPWRILPAAASTEQGRNPMRRGSGRRQPPMQAVPVRRRLPGMRQLHGQCLGGAVQAGLNRLEWRQHGRSEEHTSELQSLMRISYAVFCLKKT